MRPTTFTLVVLGVVAAVSTCMLGYRVATWLWWGVDGWATLGWAVVALGSFRVFILVLWRWKLPPDLKRAVDRFEESRP